MALTPQSSEAFVREVDEELRRDRAQEMWRRYGKIVIGGLVVALLALAAFLWWRQDRIRRAGVAGENLSQALQDLGEGRDNAAKAKLAGVKQANPAYAALARMTEASLAAQKKDGKAPAMFDAIAADTAVPQPIRDVATLRAAALEFDTAPPNRTIDRLKALAVPSSPFFGSAGEMTALSYLNLGRSADARTLLRTIAAQESVPESLRDRVARLATVTTTPTTGTPAVPAAAPAAATPKP